MSKAYPWVEPPWPDAELPREQLEDRIEQLLGSTNMCVLATCGANGPIASPIEYWADGLSLYLLPDPGTPSSRRCRRIRGFRSAVHLPYHGWHSARGAQLFGRAEIIEPHAPGWERGMEVFRWHEWMTDLGMDASQPFERQVCRIVPRQDSLYRDLALEAGLRREAGLEVEYRLKVCAPASLSCS